MTRAAVLVAGSRDWRDIAVIRSRLCRYQPGTIVIHGNCEGADVIARDMCASLKLVQVPVPYFSWAGKGGGPQRNRVMVHMLGAYRAQGYETHVEAFPMGESRGTKDCIKQAKAAGFVPYVWEG